MRATMTVLPRRISKLLSLKPRRGSTSSSKSGAVRTLTVSCTTDHNTEDVLAQLQDVSQNKRVTCVILRGMIQRPDNIQLFTRIHDLLKESKHFANVKSIKLVEPQVYSAEYRRWVFKKTNFLHRIQKEAKERHIDISVDATLIFDNSTDAAPDSLCQNVSSWLSLLQQLHKDRDVTSLWIYLKEEAVVNTASGRRPSQLDLLQSPVQKVFQALVELFNADTRKWNLIHTHVLYHNNNTNMQQEYEEKTQSLIEVAELYNIPLRVQWQPVDSNSVQTRTTSAAMGDGCLAGKEEDLTSTTAGMDGSSGAFTATGAVR